MNTLIIGEKSKAPPGYWENSRGEFIPLTRVMEIDKDRTRTVSGICEQAKKMSADLLAFKLTALQEVIDFVNRSLSEYDVKMRGAKGNVTLMTFDGKYKIVRQMQENIIFDERLLAAKLLIDKCIQAWSKGSNGNLKVLIGAAFQTDKDGNLSTSRILGLRSLKIEDDDWKKAMDAISSSMKVVETKAYIRFYERDDQGKYEPIVLDVASR